MSRREKICWLQLSDLHIFYSTEWEIMLKSYEELARVFKPNFIIVTGDFCHTKKNKPYSDALKFLRSISEIFSVNKEDFFFVPGNHDADDFKLREDIVTAINSQINSRPDCYLNRIAELKRAFKRYNKFVKDFYDDSIPNGDKRISDSCGVYSISWKNKINIVSLNTALISKGNQERNEVVDINELSKISNNIDKDKPTIVIAHHALSAINESQRVQLERLLSIIHARAYLCGDEHKLSRGITNKFDVNNQTVGIVCGKSAVEQGDEYSDVCVIGYTWEDAETKVEVFKWRGGNTKDKDTPYQFIKSDMWVHHVDKPFTFRMTDEDIPKRSITERMEETWTDFLSVFEEEDQLIHNKLGNQKIINKCGNDEQFMSSKIVRSLITIGIPFPAVAEIVKNALDDLFKKIPSNTKDWRLDTKQIRLTVLESIKSLDGSKWENSDVERWCTKYIRRYGHNNRVVQFCDIPEEINNGIKINNANYKFIKNVFIPDLFHAIRPTFDMGNISSNQKASLADEIISFINECDVYMINYNTFKCMMKEIVTKPPHPWIIDEEKRKEIFDYDCNSVTHNLKKIKSSEINNEEIPLSVFIEILHHTSSMMLDGYFDFCGCSDLDSMNILIALIKKLCESRIHCEKWDYSLESPEIQKFVEAFSKQDVAMVDYYAILNSINPQKTQPSNSKSYIANIKEFVDISLRVAKDFENSEEADCVGAINL